MRLAASPRTAFGDQQVPRIVTDGSDGALIAWKD